MKTLHKIKISDALDTQIKECVRLSERRKADVIREALRIGLRRVGNRVQSRLEKSIRDAVAQAPVPATVAQFKTKMKSIADGN